MILSILVNGLWQGAPIVAVAYVLASIVPQRDAATRCALWFATLLALVVVPIAVTFSNAGALLVDAFASHSAAGYTVSLLPAGHFVDGAGTWIARAAVWILGIWLAVAGFNVARLLASFIRIERIRRGATPFGDAARGPSNVFVSDDVAVPIVAGLFKPAIVLPKALPAQLSPADLRRIVEHERAHVRRYDTLLNLIQRLIEALLFFNPWVRLAGSRLCAEREAACDDWVVENVGDADEYAACLAALARSVRCSKAPLLTPSVFRSHHSLVARIERLGRSEARRLTVNSYAMGGTVVLFVVITLALQALSPALALSPVGSNVSALPARGSALAAACAHPNADARIVTAAAPQLPTGAKLKGTVNVLVTISPDGHVLQTRVIQSSGNATFDAAVVDAAKRSTYAPKVVNCAPVRGAYVFHAEFAPDK